MSLDYTDRGVLEKLIEYEINQVPILIETFRDPETKTRLQITNPEEFCYGYIHGSIIRGFIAHYLDRHKDIQIISDVIMKEMGKIIQKRSREIKDGIFNCG